MFKVPENTLYLPKFIVFQSEDFIFHNCITYLYERYSLSDGRLFVISHAGRG
jgi:hypothetical protein